MATDAPAAPAADPAKTAAKKPEPRPYLITSKANLDLSADPAQVVAALEASAGGDGENTQLQVYVVVGVAEGLNPTAALKEFGSENDINGDFDLIAEKTIKTFTDVSTSSKRTVKLG